MSFKYQCDVCGKGENDEYRIEIYHRACRLKAAFPDAASETGDGLVVLDMSKVAALLAHPKAMTRDGVEFERWPDGRVSISVEVRVANSYSAWSWWIPADEWQAIIAALAQEQAS